jgi:hypothetical protein
MTSVEWSHQSRRVLEFTGGKADSRRIFYRGKICRRKNVGDRAKRRGPRKASGEI